MDLPGTNQKKAEAADASEEMTSAEQKTSADERLKLVLDDLIPEILCRLPPKYVLRSKLVSKSWQAMVSHPSFAPQHAKLRDTERGVLYGLLFFQWMFWVRMVALTYFDDGGGRRWINGAQLSTGRDEKFSVTNTCRGLVCVLGATVSFLINPSMEEAVRLPGGAAPHDVFGGTPPAGGLFFDESTGRYVVVRVFIRGDWYDWSTGCEVLTVGHDDTWRPVKDSPVAVSPKAPPVFAGGLLLWLMNNSMVHAEDLNALIAFDPKKEAFVQVDLPEGSCALTCSTGIVELDGQLCYWERYNHELSICIWVSKSNDFKWQKLLCIRDLIQARPTWMNVRHSNCTWAPVTTWNGKIILSNERGQIAYYDLGAKAFDPETADVPYGRAMTYSGTLVSPKALLRKPDGAGEGSQAVQPDELRMVSYPDIWGPELDGGAADGMQYSSPRRAKKKKKKVLTSDDEELHVDMSWFF